MNEFGVHGRLKDVTPAARGALFTDLVKVINDSKLSSVAATLTSEEYRKAFAGVSTFSMYGTCFVQLAKLISVGARVRGYTGSIPFVLDTGNPYQHQILEAYSFLARHKEKFDLNVGALAFDSDHNLAALQAADVIAWSIRRRLAATFKNGFEPLAELFVERHVEQEYKEEWMTQVSKTIRDSIIT